MNPLEWLLEGTIAVGASHILVREVVGSAFGPASAILGMRRKVWAWPVWIAVDVVGVPLLFGAGYYPSAVLYLVYGAFCVWGFATWVKVRRDLRHRAAVAEKALT